MEIRTIENLEYRKIPTIHYKADHNTVVTTRKSLAHLVGNIYIGEPKADAYNQIHYNLYTMYPQVENLALEYSAAHPYNSTETVTEIAERLHRDTLENWMESIKTGVEHSAYFRNSEIQYIAHVDMDLARKMLDSKKRYMEERDRRDKERQAELRREHAELVQKENAALAETVENALDKIRNGGMIDNLQIRIYELTEDSYTWRETSLILYLMKQYGVSIPLKTQGWINKVLTAITVKDHHCSAYYKNNYGGKSEAIWKYAELLIRAVETCESGREAV